jgi:membrane-bound ClpP family serine protease
MPPVALSLFGFFQTIGTLSAILFIVGLLLLVVEMFIPGFGIAGGTGLLLLVIGIIITARSWTDALVMTAILLALVALFLFIILRSAKKGLLHRRLILWSASRTEQGFIATPDYSNLVGREGMTLTVLRPAGYGDFDGQRLDIVTEGNYIPKGTKISVIRTEGRRIVVEPAPPAAEAGSTGQA